MANGRELLMAHRAAMMGGKPTAKDYVQDGLVAMWDGIENAGWGVHDPNATAWKDLVGSHDISLSSSATVKADSVTFEGMPFNILANVADVLGDDGYVEFAGVCHPTDLSGVSAYVSLSTTNATASSYQFRINDPIDRFFLRNYDVTVKSRSSYTDEDIQFDVCFGAYYSEDDAFWRCDTYSFGTPVAIGIKPYVNSGLPINKAVSMFCNRSQLTLHAIRLYDSRRTADQVAANYAINKTRFNLI